MWRPRVISSENGTQAIVEGDRTIFNYSYIRTRQDIKRWRLFAWNRKYTLPKNKKYASAALLIAAAENGSLPLLKELLRQGIPVDSRDEEGETALSAVASRGRASMVAWLLARGAKANQSDKWGYTPLMLICGGRGSERTIRLLLHHGADPRAQSEDGVTALHQAASGESPRIVWLLLDTGAEVDIYDHRKKTPLHEAATVFIHDEAGRIEIAQMLLDAGADLHARDEEGRTPLLWSAWRGNPQMTAFLLSVGANPGDRTSKGETGIDLCSSRIQWGEKYRETADLLADWKK